MRLGGMGALRTRALETWALGAWSSGALEVGTRGPRVGDLGLRGPHGGSVLLTSDWPR